MRWRMVLDMSDALEQARNQISLSFGVSGAEFKAIAYALIAIAERLPEPEADLRPMSPTSALTWRTSR